MRITRLAITAVGLGAAACFATLPAQAGPAYLTAEDTLEMFRFEIETETLLRVDKLLNAPELAKQIGLTPPVSPPTLSPEQVRAKIEQAIEAHVEQKYPAAYFDTIKEDAQRKHRLYQVGETIAIERKNRHGQLVKVTGNLWEVRELFIRLGDEPIHRDDIKPSDLVHFFREEHQTAIEEYIRVQTRIHRLNREREEQAVRRNIEWEHWRRYGYGYSPKRGWVSMSDYYLSRLEARRNELYKGIKPAVTFSIMQREGWKRAETGDEWVLAKSGTAPATPAQEQNALDKFRQWVLTKSGREVEEDEAPIPLIDREDDSLNLWGDDEEAGDAAEATTTPETPAAPKEKPANDGKVESIFD